MSKATHVQRTLFGPWFAWDQLPDSVREQALELLASLYLEIADTPPIGGPAIQELSTAEGTRTQSQRRSENGVGIR
jgi:hypothetical protein